EALADRQLRANFKSALTGLMKKRVAVLPDPAERERMRDDAEAAKRKALSKLPELLERLERKCTENGIIVHWAETTAEANEIILGIMRSHDATKLVKGKSMVSEEMHLNHFLETHGIEALETDLGEFIIQLNHEPPSHIIVPAVHKNRQQVGRIFADNLEGIPYTDVVEELNAIARRTLREKFRTGHVGLSGVNFAVAETGTLVLVENEGNGRMCTTVPPVHVAVMGLEKVVESLSDLPPLLRLLTASATGQLVTTYVNCITTPRKDGERDGPKEIHLVILDNGRSKMLADAQLRRTLQCIRCGTCLNHCPVYIRIGGHAYGSVYPGPIGKILTPQIDGLADKGVLATASSLCNACEEVCPVRIPIPGIIRRMRTEAYDEKGDGVVKGHGTKKNLLETLVWKGWELAYRIPALNRFVVSLLGMFGDRLPNVGPLKAWTSVRTAPRFAPKSLHQLAKEEGIRHE
ncbi:MAG TPA: LutB/LldF family L-lactate oxidation iron-sulfur protein, partial [Nitratidesulfovibrio sp.]|nr:LutB/LldF family L-lactate oxidation iron-sulfur protein [Nitratidesulfovibrio sp.]